MLSEKLGSTQRHGTALRAGENATEPVSGALKRNAVSETVAFGSTPGIVDVNVTQSETKYG
jgi:hypothetical protein